MTIQRAIFLVNLTLIALGAYFIAGLFYQFAGAQLRPSEDDSPAQMASPAVKRSGKRSLAAYRPILERDLFKTQKAKVQPVQESSVNLDDIEETKLQLKLWGTVTGDAPKAYAVIEDTKKREQNLYRVGDSVHNATLKMILRSKVILSLNGKDEILAMEQIVQSSRKRPSRASSTRRSGTSRSGTVRTQRVSLRRNMINDAMQDVSKLMTEIQIRPHMVDGEAQGLSLSNIKPNSIFRRMGLRNGDVLKSVDGQEIRTVDDALKLYENLRSAAEVAVSIQRRGRDRNINYNIR